MSAAIEALDRIAGEYPPNNADIKIIRKALKAGVAGEPVAWMTKRTIDGKRTLTLGECTTNRAYAEVHKEWEWIPLYAAKGQNT